MSLDGLIEIDQALTLFINQFHTAASDRFWLFVSESSVWYPAYALIAGIFIWRLGWKRGLVAILTCVVMVVFMDQTSNLIKHTIARLRPCYTTSMIEGGLHYPELRGGFFGFFSGHSCNSFGFAICSWALFRTDTRLKWRGYLCGALTWAALVGLSRIMMGKHYAGDVLVGAAYGLFFGYLIALLGRVVINKISPKPLSSAEGLTAQE